MRAATTNDKIYGDYYSPDEIIDITQKNRSDSISYTYTEPTIFADYALDIMREIKRKGLNIKNVFVTNGFMSDELIDKLNGLLDAANIDLKSFSDDFYKKICKGRLEPVLNTIRRFFELGIHIEITTLLIPTLNDSEEELRSIAEFISSISPNIPWHISRYHTDYQMNLPPTPVGSIRRGREIGLKAGLRFVYTGNLWGDEGENTFCPDCKKPLIRRIGFDVVEDNIKNSSCSFCGYRIYGVFSK